MSTGAECFFYEDKPRQWRYKLQRWPYGEWPEFDTYGPFKTFGEAERHLSDNHANPGGYSVRALPGCPHDLLVKREFDTEYPNSCDRCGEFLKSTVDDFAFGQKVEIREAFAPELVGETGTVIGNDGYTVQIRLDRILPALLGYEDAKTGVINSEPQKILHIR